MQFIRQPATENPSVILSVCRYCNQLVGASSSEDQLAIVERMHRCYACPAGSEPAN